YKSTLTCHCGYFYNASGETTLISKITLKMTKIEGEIPTIGSKNVKKGGFLGDNRNFSAYLVRK
ncbi:MAG: hypothetical protein AB2374_09170, partial [Cytobacillus gottheilii]|uniref:hypothetical protein n=1 Tax=Cytobacillus gottheilii TaxID=859144 RepID=UPI003464B5F4